MPGLDQQFLNQVRKEANPSTAFAAYTIKFGVEPGVTALKIYIRDREAVKAQTQIRHDKNDVPEMY